MQGKGLPSWPFVEPAWRPSVVFYTGVLGLGFKAALETEAPLSSQYRPKMGRTCRLCSEFSLKPRIWLQVRSFQHISQNGRGQRAHLFLMTSCLPWSSSRHGHRGNTQTHAHTVAYTSHTGIHRHAQTRARTVDTHSGTQTGSAHPSHRSKDCQVFSRNPAPRLPESGVFSDSSQ